MEEELKPEMESEVNTQTISSVKTENETALDSLPRLEDLLKSEKEVKPAKELEGVTEVEKTTFFERQVTKKEDKRAPLFKKRIKIVTGVFVSALTLLLAFVGVSTATLVMLKQDVNSNTDIINQMTEDIKEFETGTTAGDPTKIFQATLNPPRDYDDDNKELTILDKLTIVFRSIFS